MKTHGLELSGYCRGGTLPAADTRGLRAARDERAGKERLLAFHVCDWLTPTADMLNDRGMMGDGVIDIPQIRGWVEGCGFAGYGEVGIFSTANW